MCDVPINTNLFKKSVCKSTSKTESTIHAKETYGLLNLT